MYTDVERDFVVAVEFEYTLVYMHEFYGFEGFIFHTMLNFDCCLSSEFTNVND